MPKWPQNISGCWIIEKGDRGRDIKGWRIHRHFFCILYIFFIRIIDKLVLIVSDWTVSLKGKKTFTHMSRESLQNLMMTSVTVFLHFLFCCHKNKAGIRKKVNKSFLLPLLVNIAYQRKVL